VAGHYQPLADDIPLRKRPTKPAFCSRFRKRSKANRLIRFASTSDGQSDPARTGAGPSILCFRKSSGFARDFHLIGLSSGDDAL
jgi:hypothetical protein